MSQGNDIDPRLRDIVQKSNSAQEDAPHASSSSPSIRLPPTSQSSLQVQPSLHHQQYPPYAQSHEGPYIPAYYGPSPGQQYGQSESSAGDFHAFPTTPTASHPGLQYTSKAGIDSKRLRACEACRGLKVRCEPDPNYGPCKRCLKSGRTCEITAPSRKRQKKTDSRVSELEKQLADIQAQLRMTGQITTDGEGQSYSDKGSTLVESPDRRPTSHSFDSQSRNGRSSMRLDAPLLFEDSQSDSQKHPRSHVDRDGPLEGPILSSLQRPHPMSATQSSNISQESIFADIRVIARSLDSRLAMSIMSEYVTNMLPQKPKIGAVLVDRVAFLQKSKPVLFIAIMMLMLQTWRKNTPKAKDLSQQSDKSEKGNQALHLLSEVAMGNSGPNKDDESEKDGGDVETGFSSKQYLANVLVEKLLDTDDEDARTEFWFEELVRGFY